jgi:ribonuclease D
LVTTVAELEALAAELLRHDAVAVDTEFFWERTFYPVLGLVQLAVRDGRCWLVDAVQLPDLKALGPVLSSEAVTKVLHDAPQDLAILARATDARAVRVFDTRLAAGFANLDPSCSLQALLRDTLGVSLCKDETRSDWLRRPLRPAQLNYAAEDVRYLLPLREELLGRCASSEVRAWLQEELRRLDEAPSCLERDPQLQYLRVKGGARLAGRPQVILREAAAWREREARQRDWPRGHVLSDELLVAVSTSAPADRAALARIPEFPRNMPPTVMDALLAAVAQGSAHPAENAPRAPRDERLTRETLKKRADALLSVIRTACTACKIHPALVASRGEVEAYLQPGDDVMPPLAQGWRKHVLTTYAPPAGVVGAGGS